ncbi:hypothetical protein C2U51_26455 (plasmid) [Enterobacteriaceae bacterium ENNIH1]|nr:hypothetical protein C2U51_26455 [Enterobacteriaceae bacterium ENNIH1]
MGSCAAPSAKGDDKFITTDYLQQCRKSRLDRQPQPRCACFVARTRKCAHVPRYHRTPRKVQHQ